MGGRALPSLLVFATIAATLCTCGGVAYRKGQATEPLLRFLDPRLAPTVDEAFVSFPIEYALRSKEQNDVVFLGDSTCHDDVDPRKLPGFGSYNLGSLGSIGPLGILLTGKAYLDHHPKPRVMVVCVSPLRFEVSSGSGGGHVVRRLVANYGPEVSGVIPTYEGLGYFVRRGAIAIVGRNDKGRAILDGPLRGMESQTYRGLQEKMERARGFFPLPGEHGGRWAVETPAPRNLILPEWTDGIRHLASVCHRAGVPLLVRFGPIWSGISRSRDFALLDEWAQALEDSTAGIRVSRPILLFWDREFMWDAVHLNARGVERFMPTVAEDVSNTLRGEERD